MQNWDAIQHTANYDQHNNWYNSMFAANIKTEPGSSSPTLPSPTTPTTLTSSHLEQYLKQHHHQQQQQQQQQHQHLQLQQQQQANTAIDNMSTMTPSPSNNDSLPHFFDNNIQQQQLYQQQFQQAQQAAAQNQITSTHLPLGFNPLTPPGLPTAVLPSMSHFYNNNQHHQQQQHHTTNNQTTPTTTTSSSSTLDTTTTNTQHTRVHAHTPTTSSTLHSLLTDGVTADVKLQATLTPRNTPPMDVTPPKSPKQVEHVELITEKEQLQDELQSNSSEDKYMLLESEDDETIRMPIYNSHGKMKNYKCKSCGMVAITKIAFWEHARSHMKPEKVLQCPKCPFVTELKHHLEYHIRKHKNLKPFQCDKCSYTCVNKSMLNSHRKSHSSVYQYRCADCDYATKYCHSFKLHLRKYEHKPGLVLDEEGLPNPSVVIDVYGTRRGPKSKSGGAGGNSNPSKRFAAAAAAAAAVSSHLPLPTSPAKSNASSTSENTQSTTNNTQSNMSHLLPPLASILQQNRNMEIFQYWNLNIQQMIAHQQAAVLAQLSPGLQQQHSVQQEHESPNDDEDDDIDDDNDNDDSKSVDSAMDLSQGTPTKEEIPHINVIESKDHETPLLTAAGAARRKGRVLKLEVKATSESPEQLIKTVMPISSSPINNKQIEGNSSADESMEITPSATTTTSTAATVAAATTSAANTSGSSTASSSGNSSNTSNSNSNSSTLNSSPTAVGAIYECKYCDIFFKDAVLYTIHMGYHSCDDVFKCNMCGEKCDGPVGLFVHMARNAHS